MSHSRFVAVIAATLLPVAGSNVITDPQFSQRASPFLFQPPRDLAIALERAHLPSEAFVVFRHGGTRMLAKTAAR